MHGTLQVTESLTSNTTIELTKNSLHQPHSLCGGFVKQVLGYVLTNAPICCNFLLACVLLVCWVDQGKTRKA